MNDSTHFSRLKAKLLSIDLDKEEDMTGTRIGMSIIAIAVIAGVLYLALAGKNPQTDGSHALTANVTDNSISTTSPAQSSTVSIALLDTAGTSGGTKRGCDRVVMTSRTITPTTAPLTAAMKELFSISEENVGGWFNYIARTKNTLKFERAIVENGTAKIYLTGNLSGLAGVCDDPRAAIQIEETARQFPTVKDVKIFLNGAETTLVPSEKGA